MKLIALQLTKKFDRITALDKINLKIDRNGIVAILGPNGAGKTTLIKILSGQLKPSSGKAYVLGINVEEFPEKVRELIGVLPEQESLPSYLTPREFLQMVCEIRDINKEKIEEVAKIFHFHNFLDIIGKNLSRGMQQRVLIAQTFIHNPKIAFIDEPLVNLDPLLQHIVKKFLKTYSKQNLIILSTHNLWLVKELANEVYILKEGRLLDHFEINAKNKSILEKRILNKLK